jgi:hypothetical protein
VAELTRLPPGYPALLEELKTRTGSPTTGRPALNQETIRLYWSIGQDLSSRFAAEGWGNEGGGSAGQRSWHGVSRRRGLQPPQPSLHAFLRPGVARPANFAACCKIASGHHMVLLDRLKDGVSREWYLRASIEHGWSCNFLPITSQLSCVNEKGKRSPIFLEHCRQRFQTSRNRSSRTPTRSSF